MNIVVLERNSVGPDISVDCFYELGNVTCYRNTVSIEEVKERVTNALKQVDLAGKEKEYPPALSKGERAKVVIASVLAMQPRIVVLDEPTTGQDFKGCHMIMGIGRALYEAGYGQAI